MTEIKLTKRYPQSRAEDITDAFMRGYEQGKKDGLKVGKQIVLGAFETYITADRKTEPQLPAKCPFDDSLPCEWVCTEFGKCKYKPKTEPIPHDDYIESGNDHLEARCLNCHNAKDCKENHWEVCKFEPWKLTAGDDEPQTERERVIK